MRQLGKAALQRVWVELGGVKGARGQFGAVIEREGPWEVGVEAPGVVKGWVTRVWAQQGRGFGVAWGTYNRENPEKGVKTQNDQRFLDIQHPRMFTNYAQNY